MKSVIIFIISLFITQFSFASDFKVVAKVNDKIITQYDLDSYINMLNVYFKTSQNMSYDNLQNEVLNQLIDDTLKQDAVEKEKIVLDTDEFNSFLKDFEEKNNIKNHNYNEELYLKTVKTNFLWFKLLDQKIKPSINVSDSEVNDSLEYLAENPIRTRYNISQIVIYGRQNSDANNIVNKLYNEIKTNNNFEKLAEKFSQDETSKKNAGYVGWVDEMEINEKIYSAIKNLKVGNTTKPIYFDNGNFYLLIKLNDKKEEKIVRQDDIVRAKYYIYGQKLNLAIKNYLDSLYNNAFIETYI